MSTITYPNNGKTYTYAYDIAGRPSAMTHENQPGVPVNDAWGGSYNAAGQMTGLSFMFEGSSYANTFTYNNRSQLTGVSIAKNLSNYANLQYNYPAANDGRIESMTKQFWGGASVVNEPVTYQYDNLARLTAANAQEWTQTFTYDGFGNLYKKQGTRLAAVYNVDYTSTLNSAKNQIGTHDVIGNPAGWDFDVANRLKSTSQYQYGYAPDNKRVVRVKNQGPNAIREVHFYSGNDRLGRYELTHDGTNWQVSTLKEELYFAGRRLMPQDRLGSAVDARLLPYGEEIRRIGEMPTPDNRTKFGTYFRDELGPDYADQRYHAPGVGRFMTPDPLDASGKVANPSSWNRYGYVHGDPVNFNDPSGLFESTWAFNPWELLENIFGRRRRHEDGVEPNLTPADKTELRREVRREQANRVLKETLENVKRILESNESCRNLFGNESSRSGAFDPVKIVDEMLNGDMTHVAIGVSTTNLPAAAVTVPSITASGVPAPILNRPNATWSQSRSMPVRTRPGIEVIYSIIQ